jgi:hypothetical protein
MLFVVRLHYANHIANCVEDAGEDRLVGSEEKPRAFDFDFFPELEKVLKEIEADLKDLEDGTDRHAIKMESMEKKQPRDEVEAKNMPNLVARLVQLRKTSNMAFTSFKTELRVIDAVAVELDKMQEKPKKKGDDVMEEFKTLMAQQNEIIRELQ